MMRPHLRIYFAFVFIFFFAAAGKEIFAGKLIHVYVFRNFRPVKPEKMILVGEVKSKTKEPTFNEKRYAGEYDMRQDRITVKILNPKGIRPGQKLYVIEKRSHHELFRDGHMVGEAEVVSVYYSSLYGSWALSARGNLLRIRRGHFVARRLETEFVDRAYTHKRKGDHHTELGEYERALKSYRQALSDDPKLPEAYAGLARVYFENNKKNRVRSIPLEALNSYAEAWRHRKNFHYQHEKLNFYHSYIEALEYSYELERKTSSRRGRSLGYLDRIIEIAEASAGMEDRIAGVSHREGQKGKGGIGEKISLRTGAALAQAHYHRMLYYVSQATPEARKEYDLSLRETDKQLKKLLSREEKNGKLLRTAILFYYYRYKVLDTGHPRDQKMRTQLRKLLLERLGPYYKLYLRRGEEKADPEIASILNRVGEWQ